MTAGNDAVLEPTRTPARDRAIVTRYSHILAAAVRDILESQLLREASGDGLSLSHLQLLKFIALGGHHHIHDVAAFLGVTPPAATRVVDKLVGLGVLARCSCDGDRRVTLVTLSRDGRRMISRYAMLERQRLASVLNGFDRRELRALASALEKYALALIRSEAVDGSCRRCAAHFDPGCPVQPDCPYRGGASAVSEGAGEMSQ